MKVYFERRGEVAVLQVDNPPVNGLNLAMRRGIVAGLQRARNDPKVKCVVLTGTGKVFSGGADIREFNTPAQTAEPHLLQVIDAVEGSHKPVIAAINGVCMGGGLELSLACHYRIATPDATLALPEVKIGLLPGAGGTQRLPRVVPLEMALNMIVSGEPVKSEKFKGTKLFDEIVEGDVLPAAVAFAAGVLASMVSRTIPPRDVYGAIDWPVIVLLGALIPVAQAMGTTGAADLLARSLLEVLAQGQAVVALALILVVAMTLSDFMNNAATAAVMCPIAISTATQLDASADSFLMAVAIGASCAFLTPIGHQNNTLILGPGGFRFGDYWRLGLPMELIVVAVGVPLLLLVDRGSASASEVLAGALQDHRRAVIVGERTFGKGSVQSVLPLRNGGGIKLTTARYYTPSGRSIQAEGIEPDILVERAKVTAYQDPRGITEKDLSGHLENGSGSSKKPRVSRKEAQELLASDNQLYEALTLLKGINVLGMRERKAPDAPASRGES